MDSESDPVGHQLSVALDAGTLNVGDGDDGLDALEQAFAQTRMAMCVTDPNERDNPIVYVNAAFERLTGYVSDEVVGRNCRFLQGPDTDPSAVSELRMAIRDGAVSILELVNYRKDGTAFTNALHIGPIYDAAGRVRYYFGSQWDVSELHGEIGARDIDRHAGTEVNARIRNLFSVIGSIVAGSATPRPAGQSNWARARERLAALGPAHEKVVDPLAVRSNAHLTRLVSEVVMPFARNCAAPVEISDAPPSCRSRPSRRSV